ncbi:MAG TPA: hypothetical protein DDY37_05110, partial [Legionella sp.]|nr:hypothetical protein [Legionella sp.]
RSFCAHSGIDKNHAIEPTRIQQSNEIHYCLRALQHFAPWIRTIYIITNQQIPSSVIALQETAFGNKIQIIDQNALLQESNATSPVFNSLSIEWLIWRIKGLSNQFIYLNDDFFIIRPVTPDDFFQSQRLMLRGEWKVQADQKWLFQIKQHMQALMGRSETKAKTNPHRSWQEKSARLAGWKKKFYLLPHAPFPLLKETFEDYIRHEPQLFTKNMQYPFRHPDQVSCIPLMVHLDIKEKRVIFNSKDHSIMVNGASHSLKKIKARLNKAIDNHKVFFVCMQSIDQAPPATQQYMLDWLQKHV